MRLDKSQDLTQIRARTDLDINLVIRFLYKLAKSMMEIGSNKVYKPKTYNKAIDNLIYWNKWRKAVDKKL